MIDSTFEQPNWQPRDVYNVAGDLIYSAAEAANQPKARRYLRLLAALATPLSNAEGSGPPVGRPLDVWGEWERLSQAAGHGHDPVSGRGVPWAVVRLAPPTPDDLALALAAHEPGYQALHVSCHGTPDGLLLEDRRGRECRLPTERLVEYLRGSPVRLVVLNACNSEALGRALIVAGVVACAVATRQQIYEPEAKLLSEKLYSYLAVGQPVGAALRAAQQAIRESAERGELLVPGSGGERADNLLLFGDGDLRLQLPPDVEPEQEPWFIRQPTPHNSRFEYRLTDSFVGRRAELLRLDEWFEQTGRRVFAISGVGGVGKSSLALNSAMRNAWRFRALAFVSAKDTGTLRPSDILTALNEALQTPGSPEDARDPVGAVAARLNRQRVLLLLDNLESPNVALDELARIIRMIDQHGGSRVLLTLRPSELPPLTDLVDRRDRLPLQTLDPASAMRLAWTASQQQQADLEPDEQHALAAARRHELETLRQHAALPLALTGATLDRLHTLAEQCFRHPLMIRLGLGMVAEYGWNQATRRLQRLRGAELEQKLDDLVGQMLDSLLGRAPECLAVLHALLVFNGGARAEHLREVATGQPASRSGAQSEDEARLTPDPRPLTPADEDAAINFDDERLRPAIQAGLLVRGRERLDFASPVARAYLLHRRPPDNLDQYRLRHAAALLPVVEKYDDDIQAGRMTYSAPTEWSNVGAALDWLAAQPSDEATRLLTEYACHWGNTLRNNYDPRRLQWLQASLAAAQRIGDRLGEVNTRKAIGDVQRFQADNQAALASYQQALSLFRQVGDRLGEANTLQAIGDVQQFQKDNQAALQSYQQALSLFRQVGSRLGEANCYASLSRLMLKEGDRARAEQLLEQALALRRAIRSVYDEAVDLGNFGIALLNLGQPDEARPYLLRAAELFDEIGLSDYAERHRRWAAGE